MISTQIRMLEGVSLQTYAKLAGCTIDDIKQANNYKIIIPGVDFILPILVDPEEFANKYEIIKENVQTIENTVKTAIGATARTALAGYTGGISELVLGGVQLATNLLALKLDGLKDVAESINEFQEETSLGNLAQDISYHAGTGEVSGWIKTPLDFLQMGSFGLASLGKSGQSILAKDVAKRAALETLTGLGFEGGARVVSDWLSDGTIKTIKGVDFIENEDEELLFNLDEFDEEDFDIFDDNTTEEEVDLKSQITDEVISKLQAL